MIERYEYQLNKARNIPMWWRNLSGGEKSTKNRAKYPGTITFSVNSTGLKTDPGAFRFCQIESIFAAAMTRPCNRHKKEGEATATGKPFHAIFFV